MRIPIALYTDSYKLSHWQQYPEARKMVAYGEFRKPYDGDISDQRLVFYGLRYYLEEYVCQRWTDEDVDRAKAFFATHNAGFTPYPFPEELFRKFVRENKGYFPVRIEALPEGTVCYPHTPVFQITAEKEYARLVTYLETLLTMVWYPTNVATLSRRCKDVIEAAYEKSVDGGKTHSTLSSRLHDFGFRGCSTPSAAEIGGSAHLVNFDGTDTMPGAFYAQMYLNGGQPIATSIPATEHSVMMAHPSEREAIMRMIETYGTGVFACVMDSYDYVRALQEVLPSVAAEKTKRGGYMVLRPDSGEPVEVVMQALRAAEKVFGADKNSKGFRVIRGCGVIQGDGINIDAIRRILEVVLKEGYSAQNVAFGMGAGLLQKHNRDTMSFATKLSHVELPDGTRVDKMKTPKTGADKFSLPGMFTVVRALDGSPVVYPKEAATPIQTQMLRVVYDNGPLTPSPYDSFEDLRKRVASDWAMLPKLPPKGHLSSELRAKMDAILQKQGVSLPGHMK